MSITVNTNMTSLISQKSLLNATNSMNTALQRMSTGYRINSSKDDAAGMAISNKFEYKTSSYKVANSNAQMGQSMLETANGSLSNINSMLQRMRDLTEQAANGTYGDDERNAMQMEINALTEEIYRIKNSTEFNGKNLLGEEDYIKTTTPTVSMSSINSLEDLKALDKSEIIGISSAEDLVKLSDLTYAGSVNNDQQTYGRTFVLTNDIDMSSVEDFEPIGNNFNSYSQYDAFQGNFDGNNYEIINLKTSSRGLFGFIRSAKIKNIKLLNAKINSNTFHVGAICGNANSHSIIDNCHVIDSNIIGHVVVGSIIGQTNTCTVSNCSSNAYVNAIDYSAGGIVGNNSTYGFDYILSCYFSGKVSAPSQCGSICAYTANSAIGYDSGGNEMPCFTSIPEDELPFVDIKNVGVKVSVAYFPTNPFEELPNEVNLQVGINNDENSVITVDTGFSLGDLSISLLTDYSARNSLDKLDELMEKVTNKMTEIGAVQNRLESVIEAQNTQIRTMTSANSLIKDADIAEESSNYIKSQILQQTTASLLATANQCPSIALQLV